MFIRNVHISSLFFNYAKPFISMPMKCINTRALLHVSSYVNAKGLLIKMPSLSPTMMEGTIVKWLKSEGDIIQPGDVLCDIQTDKAIVSFETEDEGILAKILIGEETKDIKVGTLIALMVEEGEDWQNVEIPAETSSEVLSKSEEELSRRKSNNHLSPCRVENYGPSVRLLLQKYGLLDSEIPAASHRGIILKGDVLKYITERNLQPKDLEKLAVHAEPKLVISKSEAKMELTASSKAVSQNFQDLELTNMRKIIAKRLLQSKSSIAHAYSTLDCRIDSLLNLRKQLKSEGMKISVNDLLIKSVAVCLSRCPKINCIWEGNQIVLKDDVDMSIAVATEFGLITPIVKRAHILSLEDISEAVQDLSSRARNNKLKLDEFQGGTFTISNLGMFGINQFSAIINPPQCAILAVGGGSIELGESGKAETRMKATMSYDQAAISDGEAAQFLQILQEVLENPGLLSLGLYNNMNKSLEFIS